MSDTAWTEEKRTAYITAMRRADAKQNIVALEWKRTLSETLNNNMLMNTPLGMTNFACGVGFALMMLERDVGPTKTWDRIDHDLRAFVEAYMKTSR